MIDAPRPPADAWVERILRTQPTPDLDDTLAGVRVPARVIEEFRPVSESLEWRLAEVHWRRAGVLPFAENEVPFVVNNSGRLSEAAARLLLASCLEASPRAAASPDDRPITVLELGAGSGLFALLLLDRFRDLCAQIGRDFYQRLTYIVSDASPATVRQWDERALFATHADHVTRVVAGALDPELPGVEPLRALFCNYVLDVLPAAVVRRGAGGNLEQLCVRAHLVKDPPALPADAPRSLDEMRALVAAGDDDALARLAPAMGSFEYEVAFRRDGADALPGAAEAADASPGAARVRLSVGALRCLARGADRLAPDGFILVNDYGPVTAAEVESFAVTQRFGRTIGSGINFPWMESELGRLGLRVRKPTGDDARQLHTRLVGRAPSPAIEHAFEDQFSEAAHRHIETPLGEARQHAAAGRRQEALDAYRLALARNPNDWALAGEVAEFLNGHIADYLAAAELARAALQSNPHYSTWLWNVLGDALYNIGRIPDAHQAYLQAERIHPGDPATNLNLAFTYLAAGEHGRALGAIGRGLENDARAIFRDRLLDKQRQVLASLSAQWAAEQERLVRRNQRLA
jgi:tetratricopeptide (TPR) repeat protein